MRHHATRLSQVHDAALDTAFHVGDRVRVPEGFAGRIIFVSGSFAPGTEEYQVELDSGMGGGAYLASQLRKVPDSYRAPTDAFSLLPAGVTGRFITEDEARHAWRESPMAQAGMSAEEYLRQQAAGLHLASDDYPEMGSVLRDRPDPGKLITVIGLRKTAAAEPDPRDADMNGDPDLGIYWREPAQQQWLGDQGMGEEEAPEPELALPGEDEPIEAVATTINGTTIDGHGDAPDHGAEPRAAGPDDYDARSTEGQGDGKWDDPLPGVSKKESNGAQVGMYPEGLSCSDGGPGLEIGAYVAGLEAVPPWQPHLDPQMHAHISQVHAVPDAMISAEMHHAGVNGDDYHELLHAADEAYGADWRHGAVPHTHAGLSAEASRVPWTGPERTTLHNFDTGQAASVGDFVPSTEFTGRHPEPPYGPDPAEAVIADELARMGTRHAAGPRSYPSAVAGQDSGRGRLDDLAEALLDGIFRRQQGPSGLGDSITEPGEPGQDPAEDSDFGDPPDNPQDNPAGKTGLDTGKPQARGGELPDTAPDSRPGKLPDTTPTVQSPANPKGDEWPLAGAAISTGHPAWTQGTNPPPGVQQARTGPGFNPPVTPPQPGANGGGSEEDGPPSGADPGSAGNAPPKSKKKAALELFAASAAHPGFRFEFTAAWKDVVAKATRIRATAGVRITHLSPGLVVGEVRGDHDVYESGIQRAPGHPQSIQHWACGCPWATFNQDGTLGHRFAGRPCSHVWALQLEARSRSMHGREVTPDMPISDLGAPFAYDVVVKSEPPWGPGGWRRTWLAPAASLRTAVYAPEPRDEDMASHLREHHGYGWEAIGHDPEEHARFHARTHEINDGIAAGHQHIKPEGLAGEHHWPALFRPEHGFRVDEEGGTPMEYGDWREEGRTGPFRPMNYHTSTLHTAEMFCPGCGDYRDDYGRCYSCGLVSRDLRQEAPLPGAVNIAAPGDDGDPDDGRGMCAYRHDGPCGPVQHEAESLRHPRPRDFRSEITLNPEHDPDGYMPRQQASHVLTGYVGGRRAGRLHFSQSDDGRAVEVGMLHTHSGSGSRGVGSAMMDDLYSHAHANGAWIDHGVRTEDGNNWWASYREPHPELNTHHAHPDEGWKDYWSPHRVAADAAQNFAESGGRGAHSALQYRPQDYDHDDKDERWTRARGTASLVTACIVALTAAGESPDDIADLARCAGLSVTADQANAPWGSNNMPIIPPGKPYGATEEPIKGVSPASYGFLTGPDPDNWQEIDEGSLTQSPLSNNDAALHAAERTVLSPAAGAPVPAGLNWPQIGDWQENQESFPYTSRANTAGPSAPIEPRDPQGIRMEECMRAALAGLRTADQFVAPDETDEDVRRRLGIDGTMGDAQDVPHEFQDGGHRACEACGLAHSGEVHHTPEPALPETTGEDQAPVSQDPKISPRAKFRQMFGGPAEPAWQPRVDPATAGPGMSAHDEDLSPDGVSIQTVGQQQWSGGGADSDELDVPAGEPQGSADDIVASFQRSAAARQYGGGGGRGSGVGGRGAGNSDIAAAAQAFLRTGALPDPQEAAALITEGRGTRARNLDLLDVEGTHYAELGAAGDEHEDDIAWV